MMATLYGPCRHHRRAASVVTDVDNSEASREVKSQVCHYELVTRLIGKVSTGHPVCTRLWVWKTEGAALVLKGSLDFCFFMKEMAPEIPSRRTPRTLGIRA